MLRPRSVGLDVDRDDFTVSEQLAYRCHEQCAPAIRGPGLDDHVRPVLGDQFLIDPKVKWALEHPVTHPAQIDRVGPRLPAAVIEVVKTIHHGLLLG